MAKVFLEKMNTESLKKTIYKFVDGKLANKFLGLTSAAYDAGVAGASLSSYMHKKMKKPRKIPANVEYSLSSKCPEQS